jgi:hypothetical protein
MAKQGKHKRKQRRDRLIYADYQRMQRERKYLYAYICDHLGHKYHLEPITIERILVEQRMLEDAAARANQAELPFTPPPDHE